MADLTREQPSARRMRRGYMANPRQSLWCSSSATAGARARSRSIRQLPRAGGHAVAIHLQLWPSSIVPFSPFGCPHDDPGELAAKQRDLVLRAGGPLAELAGVEFSSPHRGDALVAGHRPQRAVFVG